MMRIYAYLVARKNFMLWCLACFFSVLYAILQYKSLVHFISISDVDLEFVGIGRSRIYPTH